jgi:acetyl-CoA C-acetyltransferase
MQALISAAMQIQLVVSDVVVAGGVEAMSFSPYILKQHRFGQRMQHGEIRDTVWEVLEDSFHHIMMGETAEKYEITREAQDEVSLLSHKRALNAIEND